MPIHAVTQIGKRPAGSCVATDRRLGTGGRGVSPGLFAGRGHPISLESRSKSMKPLVFHSPLFVFIGCLLSPMPVANASPVLPDSVHFCAFDDHEAWERDHSHPASKRPANLNVGEPRMVRLILFLPSDRPFRVGLVDSIKTATKQSQRFFGEQIQAHGYGYYDLPIRN